MRENHRVCQNNEAKGICVHLLIGYTCVSVGVSVHRCSDKICSQHGENLFLYLRVKIPATETRNAPLSLGKLLGSCSPATARAAEGGCHGWAELRDGLSVSLKTWEGCLKVVTEAR